MDKVHSEILKIHIIITQSDDNMNKTNYLRICHVIYSTQKKIQVIVILRHIYIYIYIITRNEARTIKTQKYIIVQCLISIIAAPPQTFGETERRLVICIHFTVALALRVGTIGDGDVFVKFFYKFLSY